MFLCMVCLISLLCPKYQYLCYLNSTYFVRISGINALGKSSFHLILGAFLLKSYNLVSEMTLIPNGYVLPTSVPLHIDISFLRLDLKNKFQMRG